MEEKVIEVEGKEDLKQLVKENIDLVHKEFNKKYPNKLTSSQFDNLKYRLKKKDTIKKSFLGEQLISVLKERPHSTQELIEKLDTTKSSLYSLISELKKKGFKIISRKGNYLLREVLHDKISNPVTLSEPKQKSIPIDFSLPHFTQAKIKGLELLSQSDRKDYLDMLKKSVFYHLSSEAIIKANIFVNEIEKKIL